MSFRLPLDSTREADRNLKACHLIPPLIPDFPALVLRWPPAIGNALTGAFLYLLLGFGLR